MHVVAHQWLPRQTSQAADERRREPRREQYFECTWPGEWSDESGRVSSLSITGCYIESRSAAAPSPGTVMSGITVALPTGQITLQGTVVHVLRGVGFAVEFTDLDEDVCRTLNAIAQS